MTNFEFHNPTKILFGKGQIANIASQIPANAKVMVTYGGGSIKKNGVYDQVMKAMAGHTVIEFGGIEPNPQYSTLLKAIQLAKKEQVGFLLAVGGGSVLDGTKFIALAVNSNLAEPWSLMFDRTKALAVQPMPLGAVLTLPATGSEMNSGGVISRSETKEKFPFNHPGCYPKFSVLDPEACYSLPKHQIANGIVDAFVHVMEQYLTHSSKALIQDRLAEGVLLSLIELAPSLMKDHANYELMSNFMWSATWALNGAVSAGVPQDWATHMIGHELTALHGLDHAVTLAIVYPAMLKVMQKAKKEKLLQYGERVWDVKDGSESERINKTIEKTRRFFESVGIKTHLSDYSIDNATINEIQKRFKERGLKLGEKALITPDVTKEILEAAI